MEKFYILIDGQIYKIVTVSPFDHTKINHQVWKDGSLLCIINPQPREVNKICWSLTHEFNDNGTSNEIVQKIGEAIERHCIEDFVKFYNIKKIIGPQPDDF
jgi:hypothetical protein